MKAVVTVTDMRVYVLAAVHTLLDCRTVWIVLGKSSLSLAVQGLHFWAFTKRLCHQIS